MELEDGVVERTTIRGSDDPCGWPTLGNDYGPTIADGPSNCVVVCHQAPRVGCDNRKG
ncbi:unnamed protein product [Musa banksii]